MIENDGKIIIGADLNIQTLNKQFVKSVPKSYKWRKRIMKRVKFSIKQLYEEECIDKRYPKIIEKTLKGTHPRSLTFEKLTTIKTSNWKKQEKLLNI